MERILGDLAEPAQVRSIELYNSRRVDIGEVGITAGGRWQGFVGVTCDESSSERQQRMKRLIFYNK